MVLLLVLISMDVESDCSRGISVFIVLLLLVLLLFNSDAIRVIQ